MAATVALLALLATAPPVAPRMPGSGEGGVEQSDRDGLSDRGARWRFAWLVRAAWSFSALSEPDNGFTLGTYFGVGVPLRGREGSTRLRQEHGFGYAFDISVRAFEGNLSHRHRIAATGLVGRRVALFYQSAFGAAVYGARGIQFEFAGPSLGARIGLAIGRRHNAILSIGGDLDIPATRSGFARQAWAAVPSINLSVLSVGAL